MDLVSVIVPVYNTEKWLRQCVDSILAQTYPAIEVILVDDGSTDGSDALCDAYARTDARVVVVHQPNGGLSAARNTGLDRAGGVFFQFVDSDDWLAPDMTESLVHLCAKTGADIAECSYANMTGTGPVHETACTGVTEVTDSAGALLGMLEWNKHKVVAWNKLYRMQVCGDIRFPAGRLHEDEFTTHLYYLAARKIAYLDRTLYFYRRRENSITAAAYTPERLDVVDAIRSRMQLVWQLGIPSVEPRLNEEYAWVLFDRLYRCYTENVEHPRVAQVRKRGLEDLRQIKKEGRLLDSSYYSAAWQLFLGKRCFVRHWAKRIGDKR